MKLSNKLTKPYAVHTLAACGPPVVYLQVQQLIALYVLVSSGFILENIVTGLTALCVLGDSVSGKQQHAR